MIAEGKIEAAYNKPVFKWHREKPKAPIAKPDLHTVQYTTRLAEYSGKIPANPSGQYNLFCTRIDAIERQALLDAGFRGVGGAAQQETHVIFCTVALNKDSGNPRLLFNFFLCLGHVQSLPIQDLVAREVTKGLRRFLLECKSLGFLIRCTTPHEFDWCKEFQDIDEYWLTNAAVWYRASIKRIPSVLIEGRI